MSEKISINVFSRSSVENAKQLLMQKADKIDGGTRKAVEELTQKGCEYMRSIVKVASGELAESISWEYDEATNTGKILVGSDYAIFVEYGTGIVGASSPHPEPAPGWTYDYNSHGIKGWSFKDKNGNWHTTKGQPASAFVYRTREYMKQQAGEELRVNMGNA
jgi:hypothetical protein